MFPQLHFFGFGEETEERMREVEEYIRSVLGGSSPLSEDMMMSNEMESRILRETRYVGHPQAIVHNGSHNSGFILAIGTNPEESRNLVALLHHVSEAIPVTQEPIFA